VYEQRSKNLKQAILSFILLMVFICLFLFNRLDEILYDPLMTPEMWLDSQPWLEIGIILSKPTSTILVYSLGIVAIVTGLYFLRNRKEQESRFWWGIGLFLWGAGALFAGTSYQAFSYEIKCAGRESCLWTSWWEVIYLMLSVGSVNAMMMAQAFSCNVGKWRKAMIIYAGMNTLLYVTIALAGALIPVERSHFQEMISLSMSVTCLNTAKRM